MKQNYIVGTIVQIHYRLIYVLGERRAGPSVYIFQLIDCKRFPFCDTVLIWFSWFCLGRFCFQTHSLRGFLGLF